MTLRKLLTSHGPDRVAKALAKWIESGEKKPRVPRRKPVKKQPKLR